MNNDSNLRFYGSVNLSSQDKSNELEKTPDSFEDETVFYYESDESLDSLEGIQPLLRSTSSRQTLNKSGSSKNVLIATLNEKLSEDRRSSLFMAVSNMLPVMQGSIVFAIPYAMLKGGFLFIPSCIMLCMMADFSGLLLVECLYSISPRSKVKKRIYADYKDVTEACWGKVGGQIVNALFITYVVANNVVNAVLFGKCIKNLLYDYVFLNEKEFILLSSFFLTPMLFIKKLSVMAYFSLIGVISIIVASLISFGYMIYQHDSWCKSVPQISYFDVDGFPLAIGIVLYSIFLNTVLPQIEGSMRNPKQIGAAIHISFTVSTVLKLLFGLFGVLTFGITTNQLVSQNISEQSTFAKIVIPIALCFYAIPNYALMFYMVFEQTDNFLKKLNKLNAVSSTLTRICGTLLCTGIAMVIPYFALVSGVVGAFPGTCFVFVFPVICHIQLKWNDTCAVKKCLEVLILIIGFIVGGLATYSSLVALLHAANENL